MEFLVELSAKARGDAEDLLAWLEQQSAGAAGYHWFYELEQAIESLARFPRRCAVAEEGTRFGREVRQLIYGKKNREYRILFTIIESKVEIIRILHGRRERLH